MDTLKEEMQKEGEEGDRHSQQQQQHACQLPGQLLLSLEQLEERAVFEARKVRKLERRLAKLVSESQTRRAMIEGIEKQTIYLMKLIEFDDQQQQQSA